MTNDEQSSAAQRGLEIANRSICYASQIAEITTAGLTEAFDRDLPPVYSRWTLTWWMGTMLISLIAAILMCLGLTWPGLICAVLALISCYADARFGWWE